MPSPRASLPVLLALALAAGCAGPPTSPPTGGGPSPARPRATASPGATGAPPAATPLPPGAPPTSPPGTPPPPAASLPPVVVPPGLAATLAGRVKAPAGVLSNNGAGLISDRGGAVVSNNGGGYRLRQAAGLLEQFYVKDAKVELVDAAGAPVAGFATTTDAAGGYAFTQPLPDKSLVLRVTPPGAAGALTRLVPRATREADVDLASSLVAGYVLGKYVDVQADRQGTLEKLPAGVERETVGKAATALSGGALAAGGLPVALTPGAILDAAARLRAADAGFDAQLEVVRKLLIAAGVPNLGTGLPAEKLSFPSIGSRYMAPDGSLYFATKDGTIWRIGPDGAAEHLAGRGGYGAYEGRGSRQGAKALDLELSNIGAIGADAQRRLIVAERYHGVWRLEPDGTISQLHAPKADARPQDQPFAGTIEDDGTLLTLDGTRLMRQAPGGAPTLVATLPGADGERVVALSGGRYLVASLNGAAVHEPGKAPVVQWARPEGVGGPLGMLDDGSFRIPTLDQSGNVFYERAGELRVIRTDGADQVVAPASAMTLYMQGGLVGPDGAIYLLDGRTFDAISSAIVWRFAAPGAARQRFLGIAEVADGFQPGGTLPLLGPNDMDVEADGTLWVADNGSVLRIRPGGRPEVVLARETVLAPANEPLLFTGVKVTGAGLPVVRALGASRELILRQTAAGGGWEMPVAFDEEWANKDSFVTMAFDVAPDGTIFVSHNDLSSDFSVPGRYLARIHRVKPGAAAEVLVDEAAKLGWILKLAVQPDGSLRLATNEMYPKYHSASFWTDQVRPGRWSVSPAGVPTELPQDGLLPEAFDPQGRGYAGDTRGFGYGDVGDRRIRRVDGATVVAGEGAPVLGGRTLDDSIGRAEGLAFDGAGNLYIRDPLRRQIRRVAREAL